MTQSLTNFIFCTFALFLTLHLTAQQDLSGTIYSGGLDRDYLIHFPPNFDSADALPLVFNLHGYTSNAAQQALYSQMNGVSDDGNFIVCYPDGIDNSWNVGLPGGSSADDVGFLGDLIDSLHALYNIDLDRVYSCGMSNGGYMSYKLACEMTDRIAAIASVTGSIVPEMLDNCSPSRSIPVMEIHGNADLTVPYNGNFFALPIEEVVDYWVGQNECLDDPVTIEVPNTVTLDLSTAERIEYLNCEGETEVVFYKVDNGGHTWPGAIIPIGTTNQDFDASVEIWEFFNRFDLNGPLTNVNNDIETTDVQLFPNPATNQITLNNLPADVKAIQLFDATGRIVKTVQNNQNTSLELSTEMLDTGLYWITISSENKTQTLRMVKI